MDELTNLEIDGESSIDKKQLEELKIQIDKLTESKENIKEEIKVQTSESLNELNQTVSQSELQSDLNQNRWWKTKSFVSEQWKDIFNKEKWKEESWKNVLRTAGFVATGVWAISLLVWLWKRIFGKKDDIEDAYYGTSNARRVINDDLDYISLFKENFNILTSTNSKYTIKEYVADARKGLLYVDIDCCFKTIKGDYKTLNKKLINIVDVVQNEKIY